MNTRTAYPVIFRQIEDGWCMASVPDFPLDTQGKDLADAIFMARDAIGLMGLSYMDDKTPLPTPSSPDSVPRETGDAVYMVDIDFDEYRRLHDNRSVRRNVSLPAWLDAEAARSGINVSAVLQNALKSELRLSESR